MIRVSIAQSLKPSQPAPCAGDSSSVKNVPPMIWLKARRAPFDIDDRRAFVGDDGATTAVSDTIVARAGLLAAGLASSVASSPVVSWPLASSRSSSSPRRSPVSLAELSARVRRLLALPAPPPATALDRLSLVSGFCRRWRAVFRPARAASLYSRGSFSRRANVPFLRSSESSSSSPLLSSSPKSSSESEPPEVAVKPAEGRRRIRWEAVERRRARRGELPSSSEASKSASSSSPSRSRSSCSKTRSPRSSRSARGLSKSS